MKKLILASLVLVGSFFGSTQAFAMESKLILDLKTAEIMAKACLADQKANNYSPINVVVVDDGGQTILVNRQDGACEACGAIAESKARTAALYNNPTRVFEELSYGKNRDGVDAAIPGIALVPGVIAFPGGLPIKVGNVAIGGIGVSGASGDEDEQCAAAGIEAIKDLLQ